MPAITSALLIDASVATGGLATGTSTVINANAAAAAGVGLSERISTAATIGGIGLQVKGSLDAAKAQEKADKLAERRANLEARRERREQIRRSQIARADLEANAIEGGAQTSSAFAGGIAGITGATASNLKNIEQGQELGRSAFNIRKNLNKANTLQNFGGALTQNADLFGRVFGGRRF
jgi:hypothetical protein